MEENENERHWAAIQWSDLPPLISEELRSRTPDTQVLKEWLINEFRKQSMISAPKGQAIQKLEKSAFRAWWWHQVEESPVNFQFSRFGPRRGLLFLDQVGKISAVSQRFCNICYTRESDIKSVPYVIFSVRIPPASHQSLTSAQKTMFHSQIKDELAKKDMSIKDGSPVCITLTFVIGSTKQHPDIDNLSKSALDGVSRALKFNDKFVHHLNATKLLIVGAENHMAVGIRPSTINDHSDIIFDEWYNPWTGQPKLDWK